MPSNPRFFIKTGPVLKTARAVQAAPATLASAVGSVLGACLLVTLAAQARVPVPGTEVPMTLQLLAVLLTGLLLPANHAAAALSAYLVLGTAGLPVFSPGSSGLWGPTGGYLVGFIPGAWLVSKLRGTREARVFRLFGAGAVGVAVVFVCGIVWRVGWLSGDWRLALQSGLLPFALKAMVELCLAVVLARSVCRWRSRRVDPQVSKFMRR